MTFQFIGFRLRDRWFGLPIEVMEKATLMGKVDGDPLNTGINFTEYEGQELLVLNVARLIFGEVSTIDLQTQEVQFLMVIKAKDCGLLALPIDSPPSVFRIPESALVPLPEVYPEPVNIRCITPTVAQIRDREPLLLLDVDLLCQNAI